MDNIEEPLPSYYAIIPADVRYSKVLCDGAKLLYGEITCLCQKYGYSFASNGYIAKLYEKDANTISRWIQELSEAGFILSVIDRKNGNKRRIYLSPKINIPIHKNEDTPIHKNVEHNNIKKNNKTKVINSIELEKDIEIRKKNFYDAIMLYKNNTKKKVSYPTQLYINFFNYWIESNGLNGGTKMRFESQKFFQIDKRLATFWSNTNEPKRGEMWKQDEAESKPKIVIPELFKANIDE